MANGPEAVKQSSRRELRFEQVRVRRGFEEIYDQIRAEIAAGRLRPGDRLPAERDLAERFGVSRQAVREALRSLQSSGLIESRVGVGGGSFILPGDPATIARGLEDLAVLGAITNESLLESRILMTSDAIRLVCARATDDEFDRLEADIDLLEELTQKQSLIQRADQRINFYGILSDLTHNEVFALFLNSLNGIVRMRINARGVPPMDGVIETRRTLVRELRERNVEAATELLVAHFHKLEAHIVEAEHRAEAREGEQ